MRVHGVLLCAWLPLAAQTPSRDLADLNWMEFRELVPAKIQTVLLPTGTLEAHGLITNRADVTGGWSTLPQRHPAAPLTN
jgi:creatinine amidohydrolase